MTSILLFTLSMKLTYIINFTTDKALYSVCALGAQLNETVFQSVSRNPWEICGQFLRLPLPTGLYKLLSVDFKLLCSDGSFCRNIWWSSQLGKKIKPLDLEVVEVAACSWVLHRILHTVSSVAYSLTKINATLRWMPTTAFKVLIRSLTHRCSTLFHVFLECGLQKWYLQSLLIGSNG